MPATRLLVALTMTVAALAAPARHLARAPKPPTTPMRNPVNYFEIPVRDLARAIAFYERVFETKLERTTVDGHPMALFPAADGGPGVSGALATGDSYVPSLHGTRVYFSVTDVDQALARARDAGGKVLYPRTSIGELGVVAEFEDSEGNRIALHAPPAGSPAP